MISPICAKQEFCYIEEPSLKHKLSSTTEKIIQLNPELILGDARLFNYDLKEHSIVLSQPFQVLLKLLIQLEELDPEAMTAKTINDLNSVLQKAQGPAGGLLRKEGTERWHLNDNPVKLQYRQTFEDLFKQLGFVEAKSIDEEMIVDHCIIFGARVERMEARILQTLNYLKTNLKVTEHVFLKGSNRKLLPVEIEYLKSKLESLEESDKNYWNEVLETPEQAIEANAFVCLWRCLIPQDIQKSLEDKLICIKATRIGFSYNENQGHRPTTESTIEDSLYFFETNQPRSFFAVIEQPYVRLQDQLRFTMLTKAKQASQEELIERINNTVFNFGISTPNSNPLISVILDEIARNVYRTVDALKYLETLSS